MGLTNFIAQRKAWKKGVAHTTLNPEGPGCVRIHLIPPKWSAFHNPPYVVILNGYYVLPLGYSWAILLENFIEEVDTFDGAPMEESDMERVMDTAVKKTRKAYPGVSNEELRTDLKEMLDVLFDIARNKEPTSEIGALSLREYAPHMTAPHRMDLMVSAMTTGAGEWHCNLKCRHCYAAGQYAANAKELTTAEWKAIIDRCRKANIPQLTFTGGEPTMRSDLVELIDHARWFVTRLNTNGLLLTPELCGALCAASLDSVQVTLYSEKAEVHNVLVGADGWEGSVAGIKNALAAGLDLSVNTPLCHDNADYRATLEFLHGLGVRYVSCSGLIETGKAAGTAGSSQLSIEEMDEILRTAAAFCKENDMEISFTSPGRASVEVLRELGITVPMCGACLSNMAVAPDGAVVPCQSWLEEGMALGNMLTDDWAKIWSHPTCLKIRGMEEAESLNCPLRTGRERGCGV